jgi:hypothetical protein
MDKSNGYVIEVLLLVIFTGISTHLMAKTLVCTYQRYVCTHTIRELSAVSSQ